MDFRKLNKYQLMEFLELFNEPYIIHDINPFNMTEEEMNTINKELKNELVRKSTDLYNRLLELNDSNVQITPGVYELIKSTTLINSEQRYNERDIDNMSPEKVREFSNVLGLPYRIDNKITIKNILLMAGLINSVMTTYPNRDTASVAIKYPLDRYSVVETIEHVNPNKFNEMRMYMEGEGIMESIYNRPLESSDYQKLSNAIEKGELNDESNIALIQNATEAQIDEKTVYLNSNNNPIMRKDLIGSLVYEGLQLNNNKYDLLLGS